MNRGPLAPLVPTELVERLSAATVGSRERPILFSGPMVRALLAGRKTQTRRVVKGQALEWLESGFTPAFTAEPGNFLCPYGYAGDRLWVRETHAIVPRTAYAMSEGVQQTLKPGDAHDAAVYAADWQRSGPGRWRPSIHMPRWASRLTLEITDVRIQRLLDCSDADAQAEGLQWVTPGMWCVDRTLPIITHEPRPAYFELWDHINGAGAAAANPWVWVVSFAVQQSAAQAGDTAGGYPTKSDEPKDLPDTTGEKR